MLKELYSDRRKGITDEELLEGYFEYRKVIRVENLDYSKSSNKSEVHIQGKFFDQEGEFRAKHEGKDSALAALKAAVDERFGQTTIQSHQSESDSAGINANSISTILLLDEEGNMVQGKGIDQDIEISAMKAFINAVNNAYINRHFRIES